MRSATRDWSRVIVTGAGSASTPTLRRLVEASGGKAGRALRLINGHAAFVPNAALEALARHPAIARISLDQPVLGAMERTSKTVRATDVRTGLGYDGSGIGVAVIDSGVTPANADLAGPDGTERVAAFVDFVNAATTPYDDYGHGTHVAGIVAGNGRQSDGERAGIAPGASLIVLKALDQDGAGLTSNVIAALEYAIANKDALNIRVVNLSLATGIHESYNTDPLALATRRAVEAGLVVVASAGNIGRSPSGVSAYAGITAPGNAPWVLTVGASSHMGTDDRSDDTIAAFSSRGPTAVDALAKPDIVAPGVGIESLSAPGSALYEKYAAYLISGEEADLPTSPYLSLSGTSMSAPVVAGSVALMLQANPALTPNAVKAILQSTARVYSGLDSLTQGVGFLNVKGAVDLARYFGAVATGTSPSYPSTSSWSNRITWGNQSIKGGRLSPSGTAWGRDVVWGAALTPDGANVSWGDICSGWCGSGYGTWIPWSTRCSDGACSAVQWGTGTARNVVWDTTCGGADCQGPWTLVSAGSTLSDVTQATTVVWGSDGGITVVWGSTVVWGTSCDDPACQPVIWRKQ